MSVYVHLADVFDMAPMQRRIEYAFGTDGTDFWERFFFCDKKHPDDTIIYLFTEHHLKFLHDWWHDKCKNELFEKNLRASTQKWFRAFSRDKVRTWYLPIWYHPESKNKMLFCGYKQEIKQVYFGIPPQMKKNNKKIDFLKRKFEQEPLDACFGNKPDRDREIILTILARRPKIEQKFGGPGKKDEKWLRYLGPKRFTRKEIQYCIDIPNPPIPNPVIPCPI